MTDAEFEELDAELRRLLESAPRSRRCRELIRRRACCRDCNRADPEFYMVSNELWRKVGGRGVLCVDCLGETPGKASRRRRLRDAPDS
jgi:hypothetical protein